MGEVCVVCHAEVPRDRLVDGPGREESIPLPDAASMPAYLALPETGPAPGVLLIPDTYGRSPFYENFARRIADLGYVVVCPEPFHRQELLSDRHVDLAMAREAESNEIEMLADLGRVLDWLEERPEVLAGRMAVIGFCMGGTLALNLSATRDNLATCSFYGFPAGSTGPRVTAPAPLDLVDEISGPVIGFWGEEDADVGRDNVKRLITALGARDVEFHSVTYPHVGHGFMAEQSRDQRSRDAAQHGWVRMTAFLRRHLADV
jgi:carboxymethylenebutenolidase